MFEKQHITCYLPAMWAGMLLNGTTLGMEPEEIRECQIWRQQNPMLGACEAVDADAWLGYSEHQPAPAGTRTMVCAYQFVDRFYDEDSSMPPVTWREAAAIICVVVGAGVVIASLIQLGTLAIAMHWSS